MIASLLPPVHVFGMFRNADSYQPPHHWKYGTPYRIEESLVDQRDIDQAAAIVLRESSTLEEKEANRQHTHLDELCTRIWARCGFPESTLVWYHPDTREFWAYPGAPLED